MSNVQILERETTAAPGTFPIAGPSAAIPVPASETAAVLNMIERAARDPSVDLDKMERLVKMRKEIVAENAERAFNSAMREAQAEMRPISADGNNPQTRSKYATYAKLDRGLRPIYTKHGFSLSFDEADSPKPEHVRVLCYVAHNAGHTRTYRKDMPADGKGAKGGDVMTKTHATGAAASYGARYLLKGIFNVAVGEDDDDGNAAGGNDFIDSDEVQNVNIMLASTGADKDRFLKFIGASAVETIRSKDYERAVAQLQRKAEQKARANG